MQVFLRPVNNNPMVEPDRGHPRTINTQSREIYVDNGIFMQQSIGNNRGDVRK